MPVTAVTRSARCPIELNAHARGSTASPPALGCSCPPASAIPWPCCGPRWLIFGITAGQRGQGLLEASIADPRVLLQAVREQLSSGRGRRGACGRARHRRRRRRGRAAGRRVHRPDPRPILGPDRACRSLYLFADELKRSTRSTGRSCRCARQQRGRRRVEGVVAGHRNNGPVFPDQMFAAAAEAGSLHVSTASVARRRFGAPRVGATTNCCSSTSSRPRSLAEVAWPPRRPQQHAGFGWTRSCSRSPRASTWPTSTTSGTDRLLPAQRVDGHARRSWCRVLVAEHARALPAGRRQAGQGDRAGPTRPVEPGRESSPSSP